MWLAVGRLLSIETSHLVTVLLPVDAWSVAFSPDSKHIATGSHLGKVNIFGVESGKKEFSLDTRGKFILSIAYVRSNTLKKICQRLNDQELKSTNCNRRM